MHFLQSTHPNLKLYIDLCTYLFAIPPLNCNPPQHRINFFFFFANLHAAAHMHSNTQKISQKRWKNKCRCK